MLREFISQSGESQRTWASRFGITEGHLSSLMSGRKGISGQLALRIDRMTEGAVPFSSWFEDQTDEQTPSDAA
ncbi:hypothetical protein [Pararhodobacter sp.]|uniref:hypothetical protein n=1 Tax=Pararhodobacter sp. TaxID=2127056 RepID=UPI002AFE56ED|nr:hypothetical protein [Pararhodobacter sp.]